MSGVPLDPEEMVSISRGGNVIGTWPFRLLATMQKLGEVRPDDFYWRAGMEQWEPVSDILPTEPTPPPTSSSSVLKNPQPKVPSSVAQAPEPGAEAAKGCRACGGCILGLAMLFGALILAGILFPDNSTPRPSSSYTSIYQTETYKTGYSNGEDFGRLDKANHVDEQTKAQCDAAAALVNHDPAYIQGYYDGYQDGYVNGPQ